MRIPRAAWSKHVYLAATSSDNPLTQVGMVWWILQRKIRANFQRLQNLKSKILIEKPVQRPHSKKNSKHKSQSLNLELDLGFDGSWPSQEKSKKRLSMSGQLGSDATFGFWEVKAGEEKWYPPQARNNCSDSMHELNLYRPDGKAISIQLKAADWHESRCTSNFSVFFFHSTHNVM